MKKCNALGLAFILFSFTVLVIHLGIKRLDFTGPSFDAWVNDDKLLYSRAIMPGKEKSPGIAGGSFL